MNRGTIYNLILLIILILVQVLICNHIQIFNVAMPFVFIYVIIRLPMTVSTNWLLTWAFVGGFIVDLFSDTPGLNSLACVIIARFKQQILYLYIPRDDRTRDILPSMVNLGLANYSKYLLTMTLLYCILIFSLEYFSFANVKEIAIMSLSSTVLTFVLLLSIDSLMVSRTE